VGGVEETTGGVGEVKPSARAWAPPAAASGAVEEGTVAGTRGAGADAEVAGRGGVPAEPAGAGKTLGGDGVGTAMGTPTLPLPLFSRLLLRLLGWLPPLLPLLL